MANESTWVYYTVDTQKGYAAISIFINILVLVSNALAVLTFHKMGKLQIQHYLMLGLVGSDMCILVQNTIIVVFLLMGNVWISETLCFVLGSASVSAATITSLVHSAMALDRWISINHPLAYSKFQDSAKSSKAIICMLCVIYVLPCSTLILTWQFGQISFYFDTYVSYCIADVGTKGFWGLLVAAIFSIAIPGITQSFTNISILITIAKLSSVDRAQLIRSVKTVLTTLGVYYICWTPMGIWTVLDFVTEASTPGWYGFFAVQMVVLNSMTCFFIYYKTMRRFRDGFTRMIQTSNISVVFNMHSRGTVSMHPAAISTTMGGEEEDKV